MIRRCLHPAAGVDPYDQLSGMKAKGVGGVKANVFWNTTNPKPGVYDFRAPDMLVKACAALGMELSLVVGYGNNYLYGIDGYENPTGATDDKVWAPAGYKPFQQWVDILGRRYGWYVKLWQFGGEVNSPAFCKPPDVRLYVKHLKMATPLLPGTIIVGALANVKGTDKFDYTFLYDLQRLGAFASKRRILGYNPYTQGDVQSRREDLKNLKAMGIPCAWTEFGNSTGWPAGFTASDVLRRNAEMQAIADEFGIMAWQYCEFNPYATTDAERGFSIQVAEARQVAK